MSRHLRTRQAARTSQAAISAHFADEDGNTFFPRFKTTSVTAGKIGQGVEDGGRTEARVVTAQERRARKRLDDLEKTNANDPPFKLFLEGLATPSEVDSTRDDGPSASKKARRTRTGGPTARKITSNVRKLTTASYRKTLAEILNDHPNPAYEAATSEPSRKPPRRICLPCGALGRYACESSCGDYYCSIKCKELHDESGCLRC